MSPSDTQEQFADELLSAYLDGELTDQERTEVEARLASDPATQRVLEELRAVSQAVRDLPQEPAAAGLQGAVMTRLREAQAQPATTAAPTTAAPTTAAHEPGGGVLSSLPLGRSWRGWAWAGLALAASVAIMVYQNPLQAPERDVELARHDAGDPSRRSLTIGRSPEDAEPATVGAEEVEQRLPETRTALPADATMTYGTEPGTARRRALAEVPPEAPADTASGALGMALETDGANPERFALDAPAAPATAAADMYSLGSTVSASGVPITPTSGVLVVRVNMPASARRSMELERALAANQILVDDVVSLRELDRSAGDIPRAELSTLADSADALSTEEALSGESMADGVEEEGVASRGGGVKGADQVLYRARNIGQQRAADGSPVEVLVAEAPLSNVFQCLNQIKNDPENFLAVEVEQPQPVEPPALGAPRQSAAQSASMAINVQQFNRGSVPREQRLPTSVLQNIQQVQQQADDFQRQAAANTSGVEAQAAEGDNLQVYFLLGIEPNNTPPAGKKARAE